MEIVKTGGRKELGMRGKKITRQIALVLALAILLSLFVAVVAMVLAMSGCSQAADLEAQVTPPPVTTQKTQRIEPDEATTAATAGSQSLTSQTDGSPTTTTFVLPETVRSRTRKSMVTRTTTTNPPPTKAKTTTTPPKTISPKSPGAVAVTFDDGPGGHTARLLDALKQYDVKATFFVQGQFVEKYPDLILRMHQEGHQVANHTYSHAYLSKVDETTRRLQLSKASDAIEKVLGFRPTLMRPPGGYRSQAVYQEAGRQGMATVFWDIDTADWKYKEKDYLYNYLLNHTNKGKIILMHDIHKTTVDGFIRALPVLLDRGFTFVTVDQLVSLSPGDVYPSYWAR